MPIFCHLTKMFDNRRFRHHKNIGNVGNLKVYSFGTTFFQETLQCADLYRLTGIHRRLTPDRQ